MPDVLGPGDGDAYERVRSFHYDGFVVDDPEILPEALHDDVARAFDSLLREG